MSNTLNELRELLARYKRANGAGSIKVANAMIPDIAELIITYVDEASDPTIVQRVLDAPLRQPAKQFLVEPVRSKPVVVADVTDNTDERVAQILTEQNESVLTAVVDMNRLNDDEQQAYIEAQRRVQGLTNNGARFMGDEALVDTFVARITAKEPAAPCAPCEVRDDGTSDIINTLINEADAKALAASVAEAATVPAAKATAKRAPKVTK